MKGHFLYDTLDIFVLLNYREHDYTLDHMVAIRKRSALEYSCGSWGTGSWAKGQEHDSYKKFIEWLGLSALVSKCLRTFIRNSSHQQLEMKLWISLLAVRRFYIDLSAWFLQIICKDPCIATRTVWHWRWSRRQACSPTGSASSLCCHWFVVTYLCKFFICMNIFSWSEYVVWNNPPCIDKVFMEKSVFAYVAWNYVA